MGMRAHQPLWHLIKSSIHPFRCRATLTVLTHRYDDTACSNSFNGQLSTVDPPLGGVTWAHGIAFAQPYLALFYFTIFVIIAALVLLSMFIGNPVVVTILTVVMIVIVAAALYSSATVREQLTRCALIVLRAKCT